MDENATLVSVTLDASQSPSTSTSSSCDRIINNFRNIDSCYVTARFILNTVIAGSFCIVGLLGNALSFAVLRKDKQTPLASILLQALAVVDNVFLVTWFVHFAVRDLLKFLGVTPYVYFFWEHLKTYTYPTVYIGQLATIWLTVFIAFTRYMAVCQPYRAAIICNVKTVKKSIIAICIVSVLYNIPRFFEYKMVHKIYKNCRQVFYMPDRTFLTLENFYIRFYSDGLYYIFSFILPLLLLAVLNSLLYIAYRQVQKRRAALRGKRSDRNPDNHGDPNITLVMIIVVLVFMVCNLPARLAQIIWRYDLQQNCQISYQFLFIELSTLLEVLNSSTNFIVYCVFRQQFRDILKHKLFGCRSPEQTTYNLVTQTNDNGIADNNKTLDTQCPETHL